MKSEIILLKCEIFNLNNGRRDGVRQIYGTKRWRAMATVGGGGGRRRQAQMIEEEAEIRR